VQELLKFRVSKVLPRWSGLSQEADNDLSAACLWHANFKVYGVRKAWHQLRREGFDVARCTVARLMTQIGLRGAVRGKVIRSTQSDTAALCPQDYKWWTLSAADFPRQSGDSGRIRSKLI